MTHLTVAEREEADARRNVAVLTLAGALGGSAPSINIALGGLAGSYLLGADKTLATLPVSFFIVGGALGAWPAATLMGRIGRRAGFVAGSTAGIIGAIIAGFAILADSFVVFCGGLVIAGLANAFIQQYRFAAADSGSPALRARAISWVMASGIAAAFIGPQLMILTRDWFDPIPFVGSFFGMAFVAFLGMLVLFFLTGSARLPPPAGSSDGGRSTLEIVRQPRFLIALVCAIVSYALMSLLMTAAPLAIVGCGFGQETVAMGIQWHIVAMFGPSFFTGALIARFGKTIVISAGLLLIALSAVVALSGLEVANFWGALVLLGLGWNFGFVGATALLTETYRPAERSRVQGLNDTILFSFVALASFSSGSLYATVGWETINMVVFPIVALCAAALIALPALERRYAA